MNKIMQILNLLIMDFKYYFVAILLYLTYANYLAIYKMEVCNIPTEVGILNICKEVINADNKNGDSRK